MPVAANPLAPDQLSRMDAWWRAANYLSVGQIYLKDNPLLERPLAMADIKPRLLGHWGTTPGLNFLYVHLNRLITDNDLDMIYIIGPGHGGPGLVANSWLEGSYTERYPAVERNRHGLYRLFRQFSWPSGIPSHVAPETPGSIHEGGELGYSLAHAYGAAFDNPGLIVSCIIGDGEAETGALATSWHSNKFLNPARDGAVLPILHLNGYKIANPTLLARISREELLKLFEGYGYEPHVVEGDDPALVHQDLARTLDLALSRIRAIQQQARDDVEAGRAITRQPFPMIIFRTPKGWTGPKEVDGKPVENTWRAHQVPIAKINSPEHLKLLEDWMKSYRPDELFDGNGTLREELQALAPTGPSRMGANPHANGGELMQALIMPDFRTHAVAVPAPGAIEAEATRVLGHFLRDIMKANLKRANFRIFGPDETASNRLDAVYEVAGKAWMGEVQSVDLDLAQDGRVMEVLSEHLCQGWLEGYLLTGRHGLFSCYEAFIHIVDSMVNQHAKWLKVCRDIPWRKPIASLNYLLTSHVWRQDHNGFSHQDPGFIDLIANKKADIARIYLPPDANCLLAVADHCLRSRNYINVIVAGKQPEWQWLDIDAAERHCAAGAGIWHWASDAGEPDVVIASAGDVPTLEALAAVKLLKTYVPDIRIRFVNVVDLMVLQPRSEHPHGLEEEEFDALFTRDRPVIFAFHGYPALIHRLTYRRHNHDNIHVRGYKEEGTTTTPFDMAVINNIDRFQLALDAIARIPRFRDRVHREQARYFATMQRHKLHIGEHGEDMPEILGWRWTA